MEILIFQIIVLLFSVVIHEVSHGVVADHLGDPTARLAGRLTLNPLRHLDPFGSVILPIMLALLPGGIVFGWAKPVPYNPMNLKNPERGAAMIAAAGPLSNLTIALVFSLIFRVTATISSNSSLLGFISQIVLINIVLAVFNLVPIPPLDGSKVLFALLPPSMNNLKHTLERYGFIIVLLFIFSGIGIISPVISAIYRLFIGG